MVSAQELTKLLYHRLFPIHLLKRTTSRERTSKIFLVHHNLKLWDSDTSRDRVFQQHRSSLELRPHLGRAVCITSSTELAILMIQILYFNLGFFLPYCFSNALPFLVFVKKSMNTHFRSHKTIMQQKELKYSFRTVGFGLTCYF